ncbi:hypothetical protein [Mesorhizobium sp. IMUNJ 23232]|uniref:hypothetical protein n=1 Tax=Mesorhizobium sp. IMUNJ 23232 TaxID=3376064 RepID=UPI00378FBCF3
MSKREGHVQSIIRALFVAQPDRIFTAVELAQAIYGEVSRTGCKAVRRAADPIAAEKGWMRRRMEGRVDYVRWETVDRMCRDKAARAQSMGYSQ